jgi:hypothetical protein
MNFLDEIRAEMIMRNILMNFLSKIRVEMIMKTVLVNYLKKIRVKMILMIPNKILTSAYNLHNF